MIRMLVWQVMSVGYCDCVGCKGLGAFVCGLIYEIEYAVELRYHRASTEHGRVWVETHGVWCAQHSVGFWLGVVESTRVEMNVLSCDEYLLAAATTHDCCMCRAK
jgi:hypothetical protein